MGQPVSRTLKKDTESGVQNPFFQFFFQRISPVFNIFPNDAIKILREGLEHLSSPLCTSLVVTGNLGGSLGLGKIGGNALVLNQTAKRTQLLPDPTLTLISKE